MTNMTRRLWNCRAGRLRFEIVTTLIPIITAVHLACLSQIETGDNDRAIGSAGEISRWQMTPQTVKRQLRENPLLRGRGLTAKDIFQQPKLARIAVADEWEHWIGVFRTAYRREPTAVEAYLCWNRPSRPTSPRPRELERAQRFANLLAVMVAKEKITK